MMHEIDTGGWKEFKLGKLFDIIKGRRLTKANMLEGDINFIGSSAMNNGITARIGNIEHVHDGAVLTVCYNGSVGETFYQDEPFWASDDVNILKPKHIVSKEALLFVGTIIRHLGQAYDWTDKWTRDVMLDTSIKLPATSSGDPDWAYMDAYMSGILAEERDYANNLTNQNFAKHEIDTSGWQEFRVGKLFDMFKPPVLHDRQVMPSEIGLPYVVRSKFNNGIKDLVVTDKDVDPSPAGVITWGAENASFFYQEKPFYSGRDIYCLDTRGLSMNACHFLAAVLSTVASKYPYNYGLFPDLLKHEVVKLPIAPSGDPDWAYMDAYMSKIMDEEKAEADVLTA